MGIWNEVIREVRDFFGYPKTETIVVGEHVTVNEDEDRLIVENFHPEYRDGKKYYVTCKEGDVQDNTFNGKTCKRLECYIDGEDERCEFPEEFDVFNIEEMQDIKNKDKFKGKTHETFLRIEGVNW